MKRKVFYAMMFAALFIFAVINTGGCGGSSSSSGGSSTEEGSNQNGEGENSGGFNPTGNEESIDRFPSLNGTEWQVSRVRVSPDEGSETFSVVEISRTGKVKFAVNGDALSLVDGSGNTPYDAITGKFKDSAGNEITVPLIQSASGFKSYIDPDGWTHQTSLNVSANGYRATAERLRIIGQDTSLLEVTFGITFTITDSNGATHSYQSCIELLPSTGDDDDYGGNNDWVDIEDKIIQLDETKWEVWTVSVYEDSDPTYKTLKFVKNSISANIVTLVVVKEGTSWAMSWKDSSGRNRTDPVTAKFITSEGKEIIAPLIQGVGYNIKESVETAYDYEGIALDESPIYFEIVGKYWPFEAVNIDNQFSVDGVKYRTHLHMRPAK